MDNADTREAARDNLRKVIRTALRNKRNALSTAEQARAAQALIASVTALPQWGAAKNIALYSPFDGEINTQPLAETALRLSKQVFLPVVTDKNSLLFAPWGEPTNLIHNRYGILQPHEGAQLLEHHAMDIIFMPLVGWDDTGSRLGMGGGYYDRTLHSAAEYPSGALKVGLAHACQRLEKIETATWDVAMDFVATDSRLHRCTAK